MEALFIIIICVYFFLNGLLLGMAGEINNFNYKHWRAWLAVIAFSLFGVIIIVIGLLYQSLIEDLWQRFVWSEIDFYWKFYKTTFFDDIVAKDKDALWKWNRLARNRKWKNGSYDQIKLKRHISLLNKKFDYDYEADKQNREHKQKQDEKDWD